ncbi:hypothetical protein J0X12_16665 [Sneathiella sp. CAU 1612]|uniref:Uncharacterized protein n=1 Tax=Sneathiella sedimenti TaxID=2816034 RepID=A0ABS3F9S0_9PROT|nr:hypothetical protein [Sneathiella sedimenti]MBO0335256.1 hypothetical protein [Sneathiella sedimenti]
MEKKRIKLNALQSKTLVLLQILARDPDSATPVGDNGDIRITRLPHAHGNHMHVGEFVIASRDATGLSNKSVWTALSRKGLVRENWEEEIILTAEGLAFSTGLENKFLTASDH